MHAAMHHLFFDSTLRGCILNLECAISGVLYSNCTVQSRDAFEYLLLAEAFIDGFIV